MFTLPLLALTLSAPLALADPRILIFSGTANFRHESIIPATNALIRAAKSQGLIIEHDTTGEKFTYADLSAFDQVMFISSHIDALNNDSRAAFYDWLVKGGTFIGVHGAADEYEAPDWFWDLIGARFSYHPEQCNATYYSPESTPHESVAMLPAKWWWQDEVYNFLRDPRTIGAHVSLSVEDNYLGVGQAYSDHGTPHPIAWYQNHNRIGGGRSYYTGLGHRVEAWSDPLFLSHITGAMQWALEGATTRALNASALVGQANAPGEPLWTRPAALTSTAAPASTSSTVSGQAASMSVGSGAGPAASRRTEAGESSRGSGQENVGERTAMWTWAAVAVGAALGTVLL